MPDPDFLDEAREGNQNFVLSLIIVVVILGVGIFYIWRTFIAKGVVFFKGDTPFTVQVINGDQFICEAFPCSTKLKTGQQSFLISRDGYKRLGRDGAVPLFGQLTIELNFQKNPAIVEIDKIPERKNYNFQVINGQKLVDLKDPTQNAIIYFNNRLKAAKTFSSDKKALVIDRGREIALVYEIDLRQKSRSSLDLPELNAIESGFWSPSGAYFVLSLKNQDKLFLLTKGQLQELQINKNAVYDWLNDELVYYQDGQLAYFDAQTGTYGAFGDLPPLPKVQKILSLANGNEIYLSDGEKNFKLILR